jgi:PAS domain S-box-containing protein
LSVLFEHYPTGVAIADDGAYYVDVNDAACQLLGRQRDELIGQHLSTIVAPGREAEVDVQWRSFIRDGSQQGVFEIARPDGTVRRLQFNARANFTPGLHCSFLSPLPAEQHGDRETSDQITVCAWTKRVRYQGEWMPLEQYLLVAHGRFVTHGISPGAFRQALESEEL